LHARHPLFAIGHKDYENSVFQLKDMRRSLVRGSAIDVLFDFTDECGE